MKKGLLTGITVIGIFAGISQAWAVDPSALGSTREKAVKTKPGMESPMWNSKTREAKPQHASQINPGSLELFSGDEDAYFGVQY